MGNSRRTWCRQCGTELKLPWWKALIGLRVAVCTDEHACTTRLYAKRPDLSPKEHRRVR
jgi:hypothetical protein